MKTCWISLESYVYNMEKRPKDLKKMAKAMAKKVVISFGVGTSKVGKKNNNKDVD